MKCDEALKCLLEGNQRYVADRLLHPNRSLFRREEIIYKQNPFATIVGCSDSRVAPEIIFDQGLGDLFTIRVAGNVIGPIELGSIDFSVRYLNSSLVLVMGHESCGAVTAVFDGNTDDIEEIARLIYPSVKGAESLEEAIQANVRGMVNYLKRTPYLKKRFLEKEIDIVGAYYHLGTGHVEILSAQ